jgi:CheY-like chemotaxis protein
LEKCTILVVDDHAVTREPLARLLGHEGFHAVCAANGVEGLAAMEDRRPDVILLDVMMPKMNGIDFLRVLRNDSRWRTIPVIALTGSLDPNPLASLQNLGVDQVMTKAKFTVDVLLERIRSVAQSTPRD